MISSILHLALAAALALAGADGEWMGDDPDGAVEAASFHHVHLNVTDPDRSMEFYERYFGSLPVQYFDRGPAVFAERSFILFEQVPEPPPSNLGTTIWHIGWAGVDGPTEFEWRVRDGIDVQTPITPLGQTNHYMYFWGPDREVVEIWTGSRNHRFEHVHLLASDVHATVAWFGEHLGLEPNRPSRPEHVGNTIRVDNVNIIIWENPAGGPNPHPADVPDIGSDVGVTEGSAIDHIAFSYPELDPVLARMSAAGVEIVHPLRTSEKWGHRSFFVRGPDGLLVEIVEAPPIPEGIWR